MNWIMSAVLHYGKGWGLFFLIN